MIMSFECRVVSESWIHPKDSRGKYIPLKDNFANQYQKDCALHTERINKWYAGLKLIKTVDRSLVFIPITDTEELGDNYYSHNPPAPIEKEYMPEFGQHSNCYVLYNTDIEGFGTPISPVFTSRHLLAFWAHDHIICLRGMSKQWLDIIDDSLRNKTINAVKEPKTITFDHTNHIKLWQWLADNPTKDKCDWPEWSVNGGKVKHIYNDCFSCEYSVSIITASGDAQHMCKYCPFGKYCAFTCMDGLYKKWANTKDMHYKIELAERIRDFPIRKDINIVVKTNIENVDTETTTTSINHNSTHPNEESSMTSYEYYQDKWIKKHDVKVGTLVQIRFQNISDNLRSEYPDQLTQREFQKFGNTTFKIKDICKDYILVESVNTSECSIVKYYNLRKMKYQELKCVVITNDFVDAWIFNIGDVVLVTKPTGNKIIDNHILYTLCKITKIVGYGNIEVSPLHTPESKFVIPYTCIVPVRQYV